MFSGITCLLGRSDYLILLCLNYLLLLSPSHLQQMGLNIMQTFGAGEVFPLFVSIALFFVLLFIYLFDLFLLLSDLRRLAHSPGWIKGNKEERGGVWLRWENLRKWWGKGQKVGCFGGGGVVTIYRGCDGIGWRLCFILRFGGGEEKVKAYLATGSGEVWHIPAKK